MERSTIRTILLVVGSAIGGIVLFVVGVYGYFVYRINASGHGEISIPGGPYERSETVSAPPEIKERFLGSSGRSRGLPLDRSKVLSTGPGTIAGRVTASGQPVQGLRLRLALNGSVMSDWAETDATGRYAVRVPYGKYRVDGYDLEYKNLDNLLGGLTESPQNERMDWDEIMTVAEGKAGHGVDLDYVVPVRITGPFGGVSLAKPVVIEWEAYPGAAQYEVQITEAPDRNDYTSWRQMFPCCSLPRASGTSFKVAEHGVTLKKGYGYFVEVTALDARGRKLATSPGSKRNTPNFSVAD